MISCAALIMASVLFAFLLSSSVVVKMLALVLGASVIIDARSSACSSSRR